MRSLLGTHGLLAKILLPCLFLLGLISCSSLSETPGNREAHPDLQAAPTGEATKLYWWRARFVKHLDEGKKPRWVSDLMVADLVVEPVISEYASSLALWRFHRRAVPDAGGHAFSFIFYSDRQTAEQVFAAIAESPALARLIRHSLIEKYDNDLENENRSNYPGATSDNHWSAPLQEVWPAYIMGASVMWLGLINQYIDASEAPNRDFHELVADYEKVDQAIGEIWQTEGQHAFLHHLNALFGYEPMQLKVETNF